MVDRTQSDDERYPDTTIPSVLPLPNPPTTPEQTVAYIRQLHSILAQNQARLAEVIRILGYHRNTIATEDDAGTDHGGSGAAQAQPPASGSNSEQMVVNKTTGQARAFVDTLNAAGDPEWFELGAGPWSSNTVGFEDQADSEISWSDGSMRLNIDPTGTDYAFWVGGVRYVSTGDSVTITDTEGLWVIYYKPDGTLFATQTFTLRDLIFNNAFVAIVYWDATNNKAVFVADERHGLMDPDAHYWIHAYGGGTARGTGLGLGSILADESGASDTHAEMSTVSGTFVDEDITHTHNGQSAPAPIPVMYKTGSTPEWRKDTAGNAPIKLSGGVPQINTFGGGVWGQTSVTNNKYFLMHIFVVGDYRQLHQYVAIQGEAQYNSLVDAQDGAEVEISSILTEGLPMPEFLAVGTVIYQYSTAYANSYDCRIRKTSGGGSYVNWLTAELRPGTTPGSHAVLGDRDLPDQHPAASVATDVSAFGGVLSSADTEVQAALDTLDDHAHDSTYLRLDCSNDPLTNDLELVNNKELMFRNSSGTPFGLAKMRTDGRMAIGFDTDLYFGDYDGGSYIWFHKNDGDIFMYGGNLYQTAGDHTLAAGYVEADQGVRAPVLESTHTLSLSNNTAANFFRWYGVAAGDAMTFDLLFNITVEYTVIGTTYWWTRGGRIKGFLLWTGSGYGYGATAGSATDPPVEWFGTGFARSAAGGTHTPTVNEVVGLSAGPTTYIGPYIQVNLTSGTFVSAHVDYTVISTNTKHGNYINWF